MEDANDAKSLCTGEEGSHVRGALLPNRRPSYWDMRLSARFRVLLLPTVSSHNLSFMRFCSSRKSSLLCNIDTFEIYTTPSIQAT